MTAHPPALARIDMISGWLHRRLGPEAFGWFREQLAALVDDRNGHQLARALGWAPRKLGKADLLLSAAEAALAQGVRPGFDATLWSVDQAARVAFILAGCGGDAASSGWRIDALCDSAEINEAIAIYRGFALYPQGAAIEARAREGVRSSMRPLFEAIAHRNPYPAEHFDTGAWNQMIVKSFFLDSPLWPIQGIEQRANPELATILLDLARERSAAGRAVSVELWRCVAPHAGAAGRDAMGLLLRGGARRERLAVALSVAGGADDGAEALRAECRRQRLDEDAAALGWPQLAAMKD